MPEKAGDPYADFIREARAALDPFGRDYAIGAVRGLAVRNMISPELPPLTEGFYPIVKIHEIALTDLEEVFYRYVEKLPNEDARQDLIQSLVNGKVWE